MKNHLNITPKPKKDSQFQETSFFPHSAPSKRHSKIIQKSLKNKLIDESFINPLYLSHDGSPENLHYPPSSNIHDLSFDERLHLKHYRGIHKIDHKHLIPHENSLLKNFNFDDTTIHDQTPSKRIHYLNDICKKLIEEQSEIKKQISNQKQTIENIKKQKNLSEADKHLYPRISRSRFPMIKNEKTRSISEKSSPNAAKARVFEFNSSKKEDLLFTFRMNEAEELMKETSNFPKNENYSPMKILRFPRDIFTNKVRRSRH
ncbi:unnamed protein product [Blepharisma stoltei]|uniref:Uncharacterized protein n=1 Tax=Blepharisma stoltei TaxID=1481888 RepID=A0AAU9JES9_9CILI|nr:unnamed protein product [Blepharisma stoltei]